MNISVQFEALGRVLEGLLNGSTTGIAAKLSLRADRQGLV